MANLTLDRTVRFVAATTLKNTIARGWRTSPTRGGIHDPEKAHLRPRLLHATADADAGIAVQLAVTVARIARHDHPRQWPSLIPDILSLSSLTTDPGHDGGGGGGQGDEPPSPSLGERRTALVLHHVLKELASKRLAVDLRNYHALSAEIFPLVWGQWTLETEYLLGALARRNRMAMGDAAQAADASLDVRLERWQWLLKVLRRLITVGCPGDARSLVLFPVVPFVTRAWIEALTALLPHRQSWHQHNHNHNHHHQHHHHQENQHPSRSTKVGDRLDKALVKLGKSLRDVQASHPWSFCLVDNLGAVGLFATQFITRELRRTQPTPWDDDMYGYHNTSGDHAPSPTNTMTTATTTTTSDPTRRVPMPVPGDLLLSLSVLVAHMLDSKEYARVRDKRPLTPLAGGIPAGGISPGSRPSSPLTSSTPTPQSLAHLSPSSLSPHLSSLTLTTHHLVELAASVRAQMSAVWDTPPGAPAFLKDLVLRALPLQADDLDLMVSDPEEFHRRGESTEWETQLSMCARHLVTSMLERDADLAAADDDQDPDHVHVAGTMTTKLLDLAPFPTGSTTNGTNETTTNPHPPRGSSPPSRTRLAHVLVQMLSDVEQACPASVSLHDVVPNTPTLEGIPRVLLLKEAVYHAMGAAAYELHDFVDVPMWLHRSVLVEAAAPAPHATALRRRALVVLGQWVSQLGPAERSAAYGVMVGAVGTSPSLVVVLGALAGLRGFLDDWSFHHDEFGPFVGPAVRGILHTLTEASDFETQTRLFELLKVLMDRVGEDIVPFADDIMASLPALWGGPEEDGRGLLRMQVLQVLQGLLSAVGPAAAQAADVVSQIVRGALHPSSPDVGILAEDALQLWLLSLRSATAVTWPLLDIYARMAELCEATTEHLPAAVAATQSCLLLGRGEFMARHGASVQGVFLSIVGHVNERGMLATLPAIEMCLRVFGDEGARFLGPTLARLLGLVMRQDQEPETVAAAAIPLWARLLILGPTTVDACLETVLSPPHHTLPPAQTPVNDPHEAAALATLTPTQVVLKRLLRAWLSNVDGINNRRARRTSALGLAASLAWLPPGVLRGLLGEMLAHITGAYAECEGPHAEEGSTRRHVGEEAMAMAMSMTGLAQIGNEADGEYQRRQTVFREDSVLGMTIQETLRQSVTERNEGVWGVEFRASLQELDPRIYAAVQRMLETVVA